MKYSMGLAVAAAAAASAETLSRFQSRPLNKSVSKRAVDSNWGGIIQEGKGWKHVTGTVTVPDVSGQNADAGAAGWVGIDGARCQSGLLQTGFAVFGDGHIEAWYEWFPQPSYTYNLAVNAGDQLRLSVYATSKSSGNSTIENLTTGKSASHQFRNIPDPLCFTDAEWIVEDFDNGNTPVDFADFGRMTFTDAYAEGSSGKVGPAGGQETEVTIDGVAHTHCTASASGVDCKYV